MTMHLRFIRETPLARLYRFPDGREEWIPRAIVRRTLKRPDGIHEVEIPDWKVRALEQGEEP